MARGFGATLGSATTDIITSQLTSAPTLVTMCAWVYRNGNGSNNVSRFILHGDSGGTVESYVSGWIAASTVYYFQARFNGGLNNGQWTMPAPSSGAWNHILWTFDTGSASNNPVGYIDGVSQTVTETATPSGAWGAGVGNFYLGNRPTSLDRELDGMLAEVGLWSVILDAAEAAALGKGYSPMMIRPQSLVEYVPMLRDNVSRKVAAPTVAGTAVQPHPKVIYPPSPYVVGMSAAAPAATRRNRMTLLKVA